ncbi:methyl-accepting chemotaxis protein [Phormidium tenue FACHB-886]|nr:methyl-accepting chemotaxis protein [Phormidium tenue FACHB-886]
MTSTSQDSQSSGSQPSQNNPRPLQAGAKRSPFRRLRFRFIGFKIFLPVLGSALLGIAGTTFLLSEVVKYQAEEEIQNYLDSKVYAVDSTLAQASTLAKALRTSLLTLHLQEAKTPGTYRRLTLQLFKSRSTAVTGLGFGQSLNGLLPDQQWLFSYFLLNSDDPNAVGQPLPAPDEGIRYVDGTQAGNFYPESDRYQNFFLPQTDLWTLPYQSASGLQTSYYSPIFDDRGKWLGTVFVDVNSNLLQESISGSVFNESGFFALLSPEGQVVSAPAASTNASQATYQSIGGLNEVWQQILQGQSGLVEGEKGYWAYARVPQNRWIAVAFVPYEAVFSPLAWISIGGTVLITGLLLLVLILTMQSLNRRLRPLLDECARLDTSNGLMPVAQDEIAQISESFFSLLEQVKQGKVQIQQDAEQISELEAQLKQGVIVELEQKTLQAEVEHLFRVVDSVAQGDLLVAAQVGSQKTSTVADSLNRLIHRLGEVMGGVLSHTNAVTRDTQQVKQLAIWVSDAARQQIQEADQVQTWVNTMNTVAQDAAHQAIATTEAVEEARTAINQGQPEINRMVKEVNALQQGTDQLIRRTQTLTNYVELTTQFAKDQKRIAAMTRVLAANASMLASRASGQQDPEQFAVITRELETIAAQVNQLASQTNQSLVVLQQRTDQIQTVVSGLDYDIQAMSQQLSQFDSGVGQSQQLFEQVQFISNCVAQLGQQFTDSHQAIAATAQTALASIRQISTIASTTLDRAELTQEQAQQIEQQVQTLLHQVEFFQLQPVQSQSESPRLVGTAANGTSNVYSALRSHEG